LLLCLMGAKVDLRRKSCCDDGIELQGVFRGLGDTKSPLWATLICNGVNIVLDAVFIMYFGWGVRGAAWATIIGQVTSLSPTHTTTQSPCTAIPWDSVFCNCEDTHSITRHYAKPW